MSKPRKAKKTSAAPLNTPRAPFFQKPSSLFNTDTFWSDDEEEEEDDPPAFAFWPIPTLAVLRFAVAVAQAFASRLFISKVPP